MNEANRFLRYVFPGFSSLINYGLLLVLFRPIEFGMIYDWASGQQLLESNVGTFATLALFSSGLGYVFATYYFALYWGLGLLSDCTAPFNKGLVSRSDSKRWISGLFICRMDGTAVTPGKVSKKQALRASTKYFSCRAGASEEIKSFVNRSSSLLHVYHGLGAAIVGCIFSFVFYLVTVSYLSGLRRSDIWAFLFFIANLVLWAISWKHGQLKLQSMADTVLVEDVRRRIREWSVVEIFVEDEYCGDRIRFGHLKRALRKRLSWNFYCI